MNYVQGLIDGRLRRKARAAEKVRGLKAEMALHELRQARDRSQEDLARELKVRQPAVAKLERRADMDMSNLRRSVEALGGSLEITARFPVRRVAKASRRHLSISSHGVSVRAFGETGSRETADVGDHQGGKSHG